MVRQSLIRSAVVVAERNAIIRMAAIVVAAIIMMATIIMTAVFSFCLT